ncbi:hypothetical protein HN51_045041 [Arachis hypogaea]|uniref:uncharacterized protein LOC107612318 isoform X1 n=1 Tax=Arachis ipaensis TaxID=130454 RepID=UPI000A2B19EF|nr:uncharacterized protein LOC107612318 isoform X1 [Arachis ipaensis]
MMNPLDMIRSWDMIDLHADQPPQLQFETPPLPESVWNTSEEESDSAMMNPLDMIHSWDMIDLYADQPPQLQLETPPLPESVWNGEVNKICAANVGGYQPPQLQSQLCAMDVSGNQPPQPVIDECLPEAMENRRREEEAVKMIDELFADTCDYPPLQPQPQTEWDMRNMLELIADVGGHQALQPQSQLWTWEENKAFESVITNCFQDAINNRWEALAACLPGRTPAQLQEHFQKLMNDINTIHNGYPTNTPLNAAFDNMTIMTEHNPLSIPIINATTPPPLPPYSTDHQHHSEEVVPAAEEEVVPASEEVAAPTKKGYHWTEDEHRYLLLYYFFFPLSYLFIIYLNIGVYKKKMKQLVSTYKSTSLI